MADVLFVCSGNTCRSPMAECLFHAYCDRNGLGYRAESAGLYAREGDAASAGAFQVMRERGLSLARHTASVLTAERVRSAQLIVTMGDSYAAEIRRRYPNAHVIAFHPPISDPFGGSLTVYRKTADELANYMPWVITQLRAC